MPAATATALPAPIQPFVDAELLRAPLLFDQLLDASGGRLRKQLPLQAPLQRAALSDLLQALAQHRRLLAENFLRSLRAQVTEHLAWLAPRSGSPMSASITLALVDVDEAAIDVEIAAAIEQVKSVCEHELRELATFTSALAGDMDVARDHNPLRPESYARALAETARCLPLPRADQAAWLHHAGPELAQLLRPAYAAAAGRLEATGLQPAAYRTVILPPGARSNTRFGETTFSPTLHHLRDSMRAPLDALHREIDAARSAALAYGHARAAADAASAPRAAGLVPWIEVAGRSASRADRQAVELVSRLFDAMLADERVPDDVRPVLVRLQGPALRMTLGDPGLLDEEQHPMWLFINRLVFESQMTPDPADPERVQLLKAALMTVEQLAREPKPETALCRWALERLDVFLKRRFSRRVAAASSHIGALHKLEDKLAVQQVPTTLHGLLDVQQLDTVPAELMDLTASAARERGAAREWLDGLRTGDWVRLFMQGRWIHACLLWPGERQEVWLFGDGASDATWAVRRGALFALYEAQLAKRLKQRNIVRSAALTLHEHRTAIAGRG